MVVKTVEIDNALWKKVEHIAYERFGMYGAVKKAINEALKEWVEKHEKLKNKVE
jgi:hypothetical protein